MLNIVKIFSQFFLDCAASYPREVYRIYQRKSKARKGLSMAKAAKSADCYLQVIRGAVPPMSLAWCRLSRYEAGEAVLGKIIVFGEFTHW